METPRLVESAVLAHPYPGLRPFTYEENLVFFGREIQVDALIDRIRRNHFLAVLGASGSGKSSLVLAGLLPALETGRMSKANSHWKLAVMRPGTQPIHFLAEALTPLITYPDEQDYQELTTFTMVKTMLSSSCFGLEEAAMGPILEPGENLLLVVDQFEEIFRFEQSSRSIGSRDEAKAFVRLLIEATKNQDLPIYVVITMRSDFVGDCSRFMDLPEAINEGLYLVPRLTREQLGESIKRPAALLDGEFAPQLVMQLLNQIGDHADQLPILQHALMRTWDYHRLGERIQASDYQAIGGLANALNNHAEELYETLNANGLGKLTETIFKCLTHMETDGRKVRRPTLLSELCTVANADSISVIQVIETFRARTCSFLMPPVGTPLLPETMIDISHESLIRLWKRLADWVMDESRFSIEYLRLSSAATLYKQGVVNLWRQPELGIALKWEQSENPNVERASRYDDNFMAVMAFLRESEAAWIKEEEDKAAMLLLQEKSAAQKKNLRRAFWAVVIMVALLISAVLIAIYAERQSNIAQEQKEIADEARREAEKLKGLAEQSEMETREKADSLAISLNVNDSLLQKTKILNELLGLQIDTVSDQKEALNKQVILVGMQYDTLQKISKDLVRSNESLEQKSKEEQLATAKALLETRKADTALKQLKALALAQESMEAPSKDSARAKAVRAYQMYIAHGGTPHDTRIYAALQSALEQHDPQIQKELTYYPMLTDDDPIKGFVAVMGEDGSVGMIHNLSDKNAISVQHLFKGDDIKVLNYDSDAGTIVVVNKANEIRVHKIATNVSHPIICHKHAVNNIVLLSKHASMISCTQWGDFKLTDNSGISHPIPLELPNAASKITSLEVNFKEDLLAVGREKEIAIYGLGKNSPQHIIPLESPVTKMAFNREATILSFGLQNGMVKFYYLSNKYLKLITTFKTDVSAIKFSPFGKYFGCASLDKTLKYWPTEKVELQPVVLSGHQDWVTGLCFSSDSRVLYSISHDRTIRKWFTDPKDLVATIQKHAK
jgi:hypothetical protein